MLGRIIPPPLSVKLALANDFKLIEPDQETDPTAGLVPIDFQVSQEVSMVVR